MLHTLTTTRADQSLLDVCVCVTRHDGVQFLQEEFGQGGDHYVCVRVFKRNLERS